MLRECETIIIVGGGIGGLSAAIRLAAKGFPVTLVEKNARVGGKLNLREIPHPHRPHDRPFRFDTGPSLLTLPWVFEDLFRAAGEDLREWLPISRLDPIARFVWQDGTRFELRNDEETLGREIAQIAPGDEAGWKRFVENGRNIWDLSAELFLTHAPEQVLSGKIDGHAKGSPCDRLRAAWGMLTVPFRIGMFSRYASTVDASIRSPRLREVLYQYATYSGSSPFLAPATLTVIPYAEMHFGGWHIDGGMYRLAGQLEKLARKLGVEIRTDSRVTGIDIRQSADRKRPAVAGVKLADGETLRARAVVSNADVVFTYRNLIEPSFRPHYTDQKLDRLDPGGSGLVLLLGVEGHYPQLAHHTKFMPNDYRSDLDAMFRTRTIPDDPCIYVCAATRTDPSVAPEGCENLFVLASAPALDGTIDWRSAARVYRDRLVGTLESRWGLTDLSRRIVAERTISPLDLESLYNANAGSIYGLGGNSRRAAFLRPPNRDRHIKGLYFAGGATHPGGGLPLVALSGKIVSELIGEDFPTGAPGS